MSTMIDTTNAEPIAADGVILVNGQACKIDAQGHFVPVSMIKPQHSLEDEMVLKVVGHARDLSAQIGRFKGHTFEDLGGLDELLSQEYGVKRGGKKGNRTYYSFDGLLKVQVAMADLVDFGAELQQAKALIDECLVEWVADGRDEIRSLVTRAFNVEREGQINKAELFMLLRLNFTDERWLRAMDAIRDAIRVIGAKQYFRFYERPNKEASWTAISIDLAKV
ncbi:DUF3164 family protein [Devosia sp. J2-20]|uniref:DUF3164 family protein n=1 Tax=Devosia sp. J2-20 TaxID=3026161 RepID=UPI00249B0A68|nr:DUF3164 family protein [Devosia sp. J2-20]WDR00724.1 DUF3164 family protein [Devosia sp. J2-20]